MTEAYLILLAPLLAAIATLFLPARLGRGLLLPIGLAAVAAFGGLWRLREAARFDAHSWRLPWLPSIGLDFVLTLDSLSVFYGLVVSGVGIAIATYSASYFRKSEKPLKTFSFALSLFLFAMLGCVLSGNLLQLFLFWELTSLSSFLLIGFDFRSEASVRGARLALLTTFVSGLALFAGFLLLGIGAGTFEIGELLAAGAPLLEKTPSARLAFWLILIGAIGKSAQAPLFFWLPRAMTAPTPVSAYLHSATLVKLGIFLVARLYPVLSSAPDFLPALTTIGSLTLLIGAVGALFSADLKLLLAYSTISHLGLFIVFYGLAPLTGLRFEGLQILTHVLYKAPLFLVAGYVDHLYGTRDLRRLGGLFARAPLASLVLALSLLSMMALPGSLGFVTKDLLASPLKNFTSEAGPTRPFALLGLAALLIGGVFKTAVACRLFAGLVGGEERSPAHPTHVSNAWLAPALVLALLGLLAGLLPSLAFFNFLPGGALTEVPALWSGWLSTLGVLVGGYLLYRLLGGTAGLDRFERPAFLRWDGGLERAIDLLPRLSQKLTRGLGTDQPGLFLPIIVMALIALLTWRLLPFFSADLFSSMLPGPTLRIGLCLALALAALAPLFVRRNLARVIVLSIAGFLLVTLFVFYRAPDLALTQILVEAVTFLLLLGYLGKLRETDPSIPGFARAYPLRPVLHAGLAVVFGLLTSLLTLVTLRGKPAEKLGDFFLATTLPLAKGANAVNTILVDYRGFDTFGEISVLVIASLAILGLWTESLVPPVRRRVADSPFLKLASSIVALFMLALAVFLHWRGHNAPGGGFIAGLVCALLFTFLLLARGPRALRRTLPIAPESLAALGLSLAWLTITAPMVFGYAFFEHFMGPAGIGTALAFDTGVFLVVVGVATRVSLALLPTSEARDGSN